MFAERPFKRYRLLSRFWLVLFGLGLASCTAATGDIKTAVPRATEPPALTEPALTLLTPTSTATLDTSPTEELPAATHTAVPTSTATKVITTPTLINIKVPLETENLPAYGWFSEDSQVVYFAYPEAGVAFSYAIATQQLISNTLSQKADDQIIAQITADLPANARVWEISPRYQNVLYTVPISQPVRLERGAFSVPLDNELWLYKDGVNTPLGAVDSCFLINLYQALWSPSETLATLNAFSATACAWENWLIDLETSSVAPIDETWEEGHSGFYVAAILPNRQLLLTAYLKREPSAVLDLQSQELTVFSNRGNEIARYNDAPVFLDFTFWYSRYEAEVLYSPLDQTDWQLIDTIEGSVRAKYISPDQKQVLLFSGSSDYYGLSDNQKTSGVWLLMFP